MVAGSRVESYRQGNPKEFTASEFGVRVPERRQGISQPEENLSMIELPEAAHFDRQADLITANSIDRLLEGHVLVVKEHQGSGHCDARRALR